MRSTRCRLTNVCAVFGLMLLTAGVVLAGPSLSGAIFTTLEDGSRVNANIYENLEDVYLDGGPGPNAPASAAGLPAGDYYFQVTDPSGKTLLSSDEVECRRFTVNEHGVISAVVSHLHKIKGKLQECSHATGTDFDHSELGAITVQLFPYAKTPNKGGVYKVWVTRVEDYDPSATQFHGFIPRCSKTDNYKVIKKGKDIIPPEICIIKFDDSNMNGVKDEGEVEIEGWPVTVIDPVGTSQTLYTPICVLATEGDWQVTEGTESDGVKMTQTVSILDGITISSYPAADPTVTVTVTGASAESHLVEFGNVYTGTVKACKYYDRDCDGERDEGEPPLAGVPVTLAGTDLAGVAHTGSGVTGADGCVSFDLPPGSYEVCFGELVGYVETGPLCTPVELPEGGLVVVESGAYCLGAADFGTKGFWHNKNGLALITADDVAYVNGLAPYASASSYFDAGDEPFDGLFSDGSPVAAATGILGEELAPEGSTLSEISQFLVDSNTNGDPREQLAQQLLAFIFNIRHTLDHPGATISLPDGSTATGLGLVEAAVTAWSSGTAEEQNSLKTLLDTLNNATESDPVIFVHYYPCEVVPK